MTIPQFVTIADEYLVQVLANYSKPMWILFFNEAVGLFNNSWEAPNIMLNEKKKAYPEMMQESFHFCKKACVSEGKKHRYMIRYYNIV